MAGSEAAGCSASGSIILLGELVLIEVLVPPYQPRLRDWSPQKAYPYLDQLNQDNYTAARPRRVQRAKYAYGA